MRPVNEEKAVWQGATTAHPLNGAVREEQRSQTAFSSLTRRAANLLAEAGVGSAVTAHYQGCSGLAALASAKISCRRSHFSLQTSSKTRTLAFVFGLAAALAGPACFAQSDAGDQVNQGLRVTFSHLEGGKASGTDIAVLPNLWLYVPEGTSPTPFLPVGAFTAVWEGSLSLDLRSEYAFQAELNGDLKIEVNDAVALESTGNGSVTAAGKMVRLNKGKNTFKATFHSPQKGPASLRVSWIPKGSQPVPLPLSALSQPVVSPEAQQAAQLRLGRELFVEHRCAKCHTVGNAVSGMPELAMDAPAFDGIGSRRSYQWMAEWIQNPKAQRAQARMPALFHGPKAKAQADAAAAYLASLKESASASEEKSPSNEDKDNGKKLFDNLHCAACHVAPGENADAARISLKEVHRKFVPGTLSSFLKKPSAHYAWIRMPNFKLSDDEARQVASYLDRAADNPGDSATAPADKIEEGKKVVQASGCLNCHSLNGSASQLAARVLIDLPSARWNQGCLAETVDENSKAPNYQLAAAEREALRAFGATDRSSLSRHVAAEFADRQVRNLNCRECHGKLEGVPAFDTLGGKLKPEWSKAFIAGEISYKPRPWLDARMPAFTTRAENLAQGLAMIHGYAPVTAPESPIDQEAAKVGQKLVSADGGFSCISCHAVAKVGATQVFESAGINLAYTGERLLKPYYVRWVRNPLAIDPATKMPVFFDEEGKSPLTEVYDGDAAKQIDAIWQYIRLGNKMPPPPGTEPAP